MGTMGSGMAPGFSKLLETEAAMGAGANGLSALEKAGKHIPGLNLVLRETLVIFREIGRGNWARVPGSISLVVQGLRQMRGELGIFGALFTLTGAAVVGSVAAIVASFFIWEHRVNSLSKALETLKVPDVAPPDLSRLTAFEKGWNRIRDAIAEAAEEINNANFNFERSQELLNQSQSTEKKLLEIEKQSALDAATDPVSRAKARLEYAKKEHDLEKKQQDEKLAADAKHIEDLQKEQDAKIEAANNVKGVVTEEGEKTQSAAYKGVIEEYTKKGKDKKGNEIASQHDQDMATIEKLSKIRDFGSAKMNDFMGGITPEEKATLNAAQERMSGYNSNVQGQARFDAAKKDRDEARKEQERLFAEAAKAGADKIKAEALYNKALALNPKILDDDDKIRTAENSRDLSKDMEHGKEKFSATDWERAGGALGGHGVSMLDIGMQQLAVLKSIDSKTGGKGAGPGSGGHDHAY